MPEAAVIELIRSEPELSRLSSILKEMGSVAIAYSGGVDSAFLLKVATAVLGEDAHGVLAVSESLDRNELEAARQLAVSGSQLVRLLSKEPSALQRVNRWRAEQGLRPLKAR